MDKIERLNLAWKIYKKHYRTIADRERCFMAIPYEVKSALGDATVDQEILNQITIDVSNGIDMVERICNSI